MWGMNVNFLLNITPRNIFINDKYFHIFKFDERDMVHFSPLTEMYASCFPFGDFETICVCPMNNFPDALLQLILSSSNIFQFGSDAEVVNIEVIFNSFVMLLVLY